MDNAKVDGLTKDILSGSKLEITNPDFNKIVMDKIKAENRKIALFNNIKFYTLVFISIDALIIGILSFMNVRVSDISLKFKFFSRGFGDLYSNLGQLVFIYFIVLLSIILVLNIITSTEYSYSKTKEG